MENIADSVFGERQQKLDSFTEWLKTVGIDASKTRVCEYQRFISYLSTKSRQDISEEDSSRMVHSLIEVEELLWIQKGLMSNKLSSGIDLLKKILGGAPFAKDDSLNTPARDFQLELRIASYFIQTGFSVDMNEDADLEVSFPDGKSFVECKRLKSSSKVLKRAKIAAQQLKKRYKGNNLQRYGLAVFDISKIIMPNQGITSGPSVNGVRDLIRAHLIDFSHKYDISKHFMADKKVLSIWLQAIVPTWAKENNTTEIITRFSSYHLVLAPAYGPKAKAYEILKRVTDYGL
jgi:hypothetical protein